MKEVMNAEKISRTLKRMTYEIIEKTQDLNNIVLVGIMKKGIPVAEIIKENLKRFSNVDVDVFPLDIHAYRDDIDKKEEPAKQFINIQNKNVIIVDDVLYTGRSVRAAMDALISYGRPKKIQLAILVDRGHRELPIRADYIGKNIPTSKNEKVSVNIKKMSVTISSIN